MKTDFFLPMIPPTATHQEKKVCVVKGKPVFYEPVDLKAARVKLEAHMAKHVPEEKYTGAVRLTVKWCFPHTKESGKQGEWSWKTTKPDTDNLNKLLKDCMTNLGFWVDDALVVSEIIEKYWAEVTGIYIKVEDLEE